MWRKGSVHIYDKQKQSRNVFSRCCLHESDEIKETSFVVLFPNGLSWTFFVLPKQVDLRSISDHYELCSQMKYGLFIDQ